jgi:biotin carboxylase
MKSRRTLLLVGGGHADIPQIRAAQRLGYYVISTGNRPEELGHLASDLYCPADYSDPAAMLALATKYKIDAICPSANDFSAISSAYVAEHLRLPGHDAFETVKLLHHKDSYRKFAQEHGITTPKAEGCSSVDKALELLEDFHYPVIVKPVDLSGGKGISKVSEPKQAKKALEAAFSVSRAKRVVVEEFIEGSRHGFSTFIRNGRIVFYFVDGEFYYKNPYLVSGASTTSSVPPDAIQQLILEAERIAKLLSLGDGIFHTQFILRNSQPWIIEICRRPPGDLYVKLVEYATGSDYPGWIIRSFSGLSCPDVEQRPANGHWLRHCIMADRPGILASVDVDSQVRLNILEQYVWWAPGVRVDNWLTQKFGIVFLRFNSEAELLEKAPRMQELIKAKVLDNDLRGRKRD